MRHCFGESVDVYEVCGNKVSKVLKQAGKKIKEFEDNGEYSHFSFDLSYTGASDLGYDYCAIVYAHR